MRIHKPFELVSDFKPAGDQPEAIKKLADGYAKHKMQTLLGVTGSGKTFTMANIIASVGKPTLILAHNKTLAAQLFSEFKQFFPNNAVEYFVSYYDYYQPESYMAATDTYIEKDAQVNEKIEMLRLKATASLMSRSDVIIISSVSCIYGLGSPQHFERMAVHLKTGQQITRESLIQHLLDIQYERNDTELVHGRFRVRGDTIDIVQGFDTDITRISLFGDEIDNIQILDSITLRAKEKPKEVLIFPARHYMIPEEDQKRALQTIAQELKERLPQLPLLEAHRLKQRTSYDLEMIKELGYCSGIENYSRHFEGRKEGEPPFCLLDFFPDDFLFIIDESHQTLPQLHGMYKGDRSRKQSLIDNGFRLPSAYDNRPLQFHETEKYFNHVIFTSATPADYEKKNSGQIAEQIIRPTGLVDPEISVRKTKGQIDDLIVEIKKTIKDGNRVLVTTLTKRMAEELAQFLKEKGIKVEYMHSEIETLERSKIIRELRIGKFDVLVGINLLREGLDIPECALVAILDADKEGFLRNTRSLIQTIGRAARNVNGKVIMYADRQTDSMKAALLETARRRAKQLAYNKKHGIVPQSTIRKIEEQEEKLAKRKHMSKDKLKTELITLELEMKLAAENLDFEKAIELRERIRELKQ